MYVHQENFERKHPDEKFIKTGNRKNGFLGNKFKTPYDDELSLFYRGDIKNARLNLKYIKRKSRDEITLKSREKAGLKEIEGLSNNYSIYTNDGKTDSDIYTLTIQNIAPLEFLNTKNYLELSYTRMDRSRNFSTYTDTNIEDKKVIYNGAEIRYCDLPVVDYYTPNAMRLSHIMQLPSLGVTLSNFINYESSNEALVRNGYDSVKKMSIYTKLKLPSRTTLDSRVSYERNLHKDVAFFANLDINNLLNQKQKIDASSTDNQIYYIYGTGRNFYLELGLKW